MAKTSPLRHGDFSFRPKQFARLSSERLQMQRFHCVPTFERHRPLRILGNGAVTGKRKEAEMNVGIIGAGNMGRAIANRLAASGQVLLADRNPDSAKDSVTGVGGGVTPSSMDEALAADIVVLALPFPGTIRFAREHALRLVGKTVVDINNPLDKRWIPLLATPSTSAAELLANELPLSNVVKAFSTDIAIELGTGEVDGSALDVFVAGDDERAKQQVMELVQAAGLRQVDAGRLDNARRLERLARFP
jgi:predicted dinucleotide-binding enzyme